MYNKKMKPRIYIDTSVVGGCLDEEFSEWSNKLFEEFKSGNSTAVVSEVMRKELARAPLEVGSILDHLKSKHIEEVIFSDEAEELANTYLSEKIVGKKSLVDAQHITIASVERVDVLVSWNFKHIVNLDKIHGFNGVNIRYGYPMLEIRTPREVLNDKKL